MSLHHLLHVRVADDPRTTNWPRGFPFSADRNSARLPLRARKRAGTATPWSPPAHPARSPGWDAARVNVLLVGPAGRDGRRVSPRVGIEPATHALTVRGGKWPTPRDDDRMRYLRPPTSAQSQQ